MTKKEEAPLDIKLYFHCINCMDLRLKQDLAVGWTERGVQVWCEICHSNVIHLDFMGQKVDRYA